MNYLIKEMPKEERPRERLQIYGVDALANYELLALILQSGSKEESVIELSKRVLYKLDDLKELFKISYEELVQIRGIGPAKASILTACVELSKRIYQAEKESNPVISSPREAYLYLKDELESLEQEHFVCLYLDTKNRIIAKKVLFIGTLNQSLVHPREIFKHAVKYAAASIILSHNHPSGDSTPSKADLQVQQLLENGSKLMAIQIIDHVIIGKDEYYSLREQRKHIEFK
ncbi:MAG TPA: hypothetical protein DEA45_03500 [Acholeplasmataceae bacterium]|nr:hypothetical protein [Acholeplasmataceae bacterium]